MQYFSLFFTRLFLAACIAILLFCSVQVHSGGQPSVGSGAGGAQHASAAPSSSPRLAAAAPGTPEHDPDDPDPGATSTDNRADSSADVVDPDDPFFLERLGRYLILGGENPLRIAARLINALLGLVGILFVILVILAGFRYLVAGGDDEKVAAARKTLVRAVIGLLIIFVSYSIVRFVLGALGTATNTGTGGAGASAVPDEI